MRALRRLVRGWAMNEVARLNKTKVELSLEYNHLDMERESRDLTPQSWTGYIGPIYILWQNFSLTLLVPFFHGDQTGG